MTSTNDYGQTSDAASCPHFVDDEIDPAWCTLCTPESKRPPRPARDPKRRVWAARYNSVCMRCLYRIDKGDPICGDGSGHWLHERCADDDG